MNTTRALRRHHSERLRKVRKHYWGHDRTLDEKQLGKVVSTPKPCGCWMCSNPRRVFGYKTFKEEKFVRASDSDFFKDTEPGLGED